MNEIETFQHYQVLRREDGSLWDLGRGAMGITYKAFDINLRCPVALKVINTAYLDHPVARQRFIREARAAAQLRHRNIASVYHLGMDAQSFFYAMEFIDGETLDSLVRRTGPLSAGVALRIALQTTRALNAAARRRLLHRDIKPANLMIVDEDEEAEGEGHLVVKVIDFGLARSIVHGDVSTQLTVSGFVGTPQYASPEQLEEKDLDARSDIYSLGVTLWFLLAGRPPFMGTLTNLVAQHLTKQPPWPQLENVPEPVRALLGRMLQKDPDLRPQSPGELRREIETCLKAITAGDDPAAASAELEADDLRLSETVASNRAQRSDALGVGALIANRFQLARLMGEGSAGRVFQAQDILAGNGRLVAIKVFNRESIITPQDYETLTADVARLREARHPNLLEVFSLERSAEHACMVMEWGGGVTLVDVLRNRGIITVGEALLLLKQAAAAADHATTHDLRHLELGMHQVLITSTDDGMHEIDGGVIGALLAEKSSLLALKIDALGAVRDPGDLATWAGKVTLVSQPLLDRDTRSSIDGLVEGTYIHALGLLFYELVNGAPPTGDVEAAGEVKYLALPVLGDAGNAVLRRALSANPGFTRNGEFFEKLSRALGFNPVDLCAPPLADKNALEVRQNAREGTLSSLAPVISPSGTSFQPRALLSDELQTDAGNSERSSLQLTEISSVSDTKAHTTPPPVDLRFNELPVFGKESPGLGWQSETGRKATLVLAALFLLALAGAGLTVWTYKAVVTDVSPLVLGTASSPARAVVAPPLSQPVILPIPEADRQEGMEANHHDMAKQAATVPPFILMNVASVEFSILPEFQGFASAKIPEFDDYQADLWLQTNRLMWPQNAVFPPKSPSPVNLLAGSHDVFADTAKTNDVPQASSDIKSTPPKRQSAQTRPRKSSRRPAPAPNFWQRLFGAKPTERRSK